MWVLPFLGTITSAAIHTVQVGNGGLVFKPDTVNASAGDSVIFELYATHDVVQGDYSNPCTPSRQGFYSGPYSQTQQGNLRFVINVTGTDPIYYYCSVSRHCQQGMVGGINLPQQGNILEVYRNSSKTCTGQAITPAERSGGEMRGADQLGNLTTSSGSVASSTPSTSVRSSTTSASAIIPSTTGAASDLTPGQVSTLIAIIFGAMAWAF